MVRQYVRLTWTSVIAWFIVEVCPMIGKCNEVANLCLILPVLPVLELNQWFAPCCELKMMTCWPPQQQMLFFVSLWSSYLKSWRKALHSKLSTSNQAQTSCLLFLFEMKKEASPETACRLVVQLVLRIWKCGSVYKMSPVSDQLL